MTCSMIGALRAINREIAQQYLTHRDSYEGQNDILVCLFEPICGLYSIPFKPKKIVRKLDIGINLVT